MPMPGTWWTFTTIWENHNPTANPGGPYSADLGTSFDLDGSASSDPDVAFGDSLVSYEWDLDDDGVYDLTGSHPPSVPHRSTLSVLATHPIALRVTDTRGGTAIGSTTLSIFDNRPVASFTAIPNPAACRQSVTFDASGSSHLHPARSITSYAWDFGDGFTAIGHDRGPFLLRLRFLLRHPHRHR